MSKIKETIITAIITSIFNERKWIVNKKLKQCEYYPDLLTKVGDEYLIVEIDEDQHRNYDNEHDRMLRIAHSLNTKCTFIRFNPDKFHTSLSNKNDYKRYLKKLKRSKNRWVTKMKNNDILPIKSMFNNGKIRQDQLYRLCILYEILNLAFNDQHDHEFLDDISACCHHIDNEKYSATYLFYDIDSEDNFNINIDKMNKHMTTILKNSNIYNKYVRIKLTGRAKYLSFMYGYEDLVNALYDSKRLTNWDRKFVLDFKIHGRKITSMKQYNNVERIKNSLRNELGIGYTKISHHLNIYMGRKIYKYHVKNHTILRI
jgi:hypothetical protein